MVSFVERWIINMSILILSNNAAGLLNLRRELIVSLIQTMDVYICVPPDSYSNQITDMGGKLIEIAFERRGKNIISEIALLKKYISIIKKYHPDIVLTYTIKPNIYGGLACRLTGTPYIVNVTGLGTELQKNSRFSRFLFKFYAFSVKKAKKVYVQNQSIKKRFEKNNVSENCEILPGSGVNLEKHCYEKYPSEERGIFFLFIGRVMKDKGIEELIYAVEKISETNNSVVFDLIGYYDESEYKEKIDCLIKKGVLRFYTFQENIHDVIKDHHCIIHPSYHEGMSNAILEAAAVGRPVIASNIPGCEEAFDDKITGISVKVRDKEDLVRGIEEFLSLSSFERERMGIAGRCKMERFFDRKIVVDKYISEIKKLKEIFD